MKLTPKNQFRRARIFEPGNATLKLSNALADYRDSQWSER